MQTSSWWLELSLLLASRLVMENGVEKRGFPHLHWEPQPGQSLAYHTRNIKYRNINVLSTCVHMHMNTHAHTHSLTFAAVSKALFSKPSLYVGLSVWKFSVQMCATDIKDSGGDHI